MNYLFVYGTLRYQRGNWKYFLNQEPLLLNALTRDSNFIMRGHRIPYISRSSIPTDLPAKIEGDLFQINDQTLEEIDHLEGHPRWYNRQLIEIQSFEHKVWAYHNETTHDLPFNPHYYCTENAIPFYRYQ